MIFRGFPVFEYALFQNTKTRKRLKSTQIFVKKKLPVANIWNYKATAKNLTTLYVSTILGSKSGKIIFKRQC